MNNMYFTCSAPINVLISKSFHIFVIFGHNDFPAFDLEIRFYSSVFQFFTLNFLYFIVSQKIDIFLAKIDRFYQKNQSFVTFSLDLKKVLRWGIYQNQILNRD